MPATFGPTGTEADPEPEAPPARLRATDFFSLHRPSECRLRVWLRHRGEDEAPPGPYAEVLRKLGIEHERRHLARFPNALDLGSLPIAKRAERTREAVEAGERVKRNLLDLLPITDESVALPLSSYGLKQVERLAGFERTLEESGGEWSMARYIEATETADHVLRGEIMSQLLAYNREDLEATWAVLQWLRPCPDP